MLASTALGVTRLFDFLVIFDLVDIVSKPATGWQILGTSPP